MLRRLKGLGVYEGIKTYANLIQNKLKMASRITDVIQNCTWTVDVAWFWNWDQFNTKFIQYHDSWIISKAIVQTSDNF